MQLQVLQISEEGEFEELIIKMRNAIFSSVSSQPYNFGINEIQMPNLDISMQVDSLVNNFSMDSKIFKDHDSQLRGGNFQSFSTSCDGIVSQQSFLLSQKRPLPPFVLDFQSLQNSIEVDDFLPQDAITGLVHSQRSSNNVCKKNQNKKMKTLSSEEIWLHDHQIKDTSSGVIREQKEKVPVRRSQKLSDRITALQKLVSPYGKTDTASVLQEANLYIKLLQEQIQNLFQMLSSSYNIVTALHSQEMEEGKSDLTGRGLCLVPISVTQKLTNDHQDLLVDFHSMSRSTTTKHF